MNHDPSFDKDVDFVVAKRSATPMPLWQKVSYTLLIFMLILCAVTIGYEERLLQRDRQILQRNEQTIQSLTNCAEQEYETRDKLKVCMEKAKESR